MLSHWPLWGLLAATTVLLAFRPFFLSVKGQDRAGPFARLFWPLKGGFIGARPTRNYGVILSSRIRLERSCWLD